MNNLKKTALLILLFALFIGCEKEVDNIPLPKAEPKLVVYSYISPSDSIIEVEVFISATFFGDNKSRDIREAVRNATVVISSNSNSVLIPFNDSSNTYFIYNNEAFPILAGEQYNLVVSVGKEFSCNSTTTVPLRKPDQLTIKIDSTIRNSSEGFEELIYNHIIRWNDIPGIPNYYQFKMNIDKGSAFSGGDCNEIFSDLNNDGNFMARSCSYSTVSFFAGPIEGIEGTIYLLTTDFSYYKYHKSLEGFDSENPFTEPVKIYSNINGGLGCFGSYLEQSVNFKK